MNARVILARAARVSADPASRDMAPVSRDTRVGPLAVLSRPSRGPVEAAAEGTARVPAYRCGRPGFRPSAPPEMARAVTSVRDVVWYGRGAISPRASGKRGSPKSLRRPWPLVPGRRQDEQVCELPGS